MLVDLPVFLTSPVYRRWHLNWGATPDEVLAPMPATIDSRRRSSGRREPSRSRLTIPAGCAQVLEGVPEPDAVAAPAIYAHPTDFGIAGIATGDIAALRVIRPDGSTTDVPLARQPIGTTQAFALVTDAPVTLIALDASATPIENVEITNIPPSAETVVPTTVSANTTPPST